MITSRGPLGPREVIDLHVPGVDLTTSSELLNCWPGLFLVDPRACHVALNLEEPC